MEPTTATKLVFAWSFSVAAALLCSVLVAQTEEDSSAPGTAVASSRSVMIAVGGPRKGEAPGRYFNVQGLSSRGDAKFASFGLLDFDIEPGPSKVAATMRKLTLVLTQSIPPFAKPGRLLFFIPRDPDEDLTTLKFATEGDTALGDALPRCIPCGEATFTIEATGRKDRFELPLDEEAEAVVDRLLEDGGRLRLLVVPAASDVAATYFGVEQPEPENRPHLVLE
ncbi:MAG: hypothetical protein EXS06_03230 [Planctomycetaceae bacterium]|nr:hypothetical protein [Planctomycetaceae bacterium]